LLSERKPAETLPRDVAAEALYQHAMIDALLAEVVAHRGPEVTRKMRSNALDRLEQAYQKGFGRIHPENVRLERAFRSLRGQPEFEKLLSGLPAVGQPVDRSASGASEAGEVTEDKAHAVQPR
jgi:hypothetical protein